MVEVWGNGNSEIILQITNFPIEPSTQIELVLTLDTTAELLSAMVDGALVLDRFDLAAIGVQASPNVAGFHLNGASLNQSTIDFIEVKQREAPIFADGFETGDTSRWSSE